MLYPTLASVFQLFVGHLAEPNPLDHVGQNRSYLFTGNLTRQEEGYLLCNQGGNLVGGLKFVNGGERGDSSFHFSVLDKFRSWNSSHGVFSFYLNYIQFISKIKVLPLRWGVGIVVSPYPAYA